MAEFKPYPAYKDSGVEWIGEIPEDWDVTKLKRIVSLKMGQSPNANSVNTKSEGVPFLQGNAEFTHNYPIAKQYSTETKVVSNVNDILLSVRAPVGAMNWSDTNYVIGRGLCSIKANTDFNQEYLWYLLRVLRVELYSKITGSTFESVTISDVKESNVVFPDLTLQKQIANYLDRKTSEIDSLISDKQCLIKLLEEKRQAIITETVTKGLHPNVKMKDSGIEWIGEIPEHWEVVKLKYLSNMKSGDTITSTSIKDIGDYPVYGGGGLRGYTSDYTHDGDYILIGRQGALCGNIKYASNKFWASEHAVVVTPNKEVNTIWLGLLLESMNLNQYSISAAQPGLSVSTIKNLGVPVPPIVIQNQIVEYIKNIQSNIKDIKKITKDQITKLKEYRESLIYEAVTGKIDLRDYEENATEH